MRHTRNQLPQLSLRAFFEITTACAIIVAALLQDNLFISWLAFSSLMIWMLRIRDLPLRWSLMSCFGGCAAIFFGLMCLRLAFDNALAWNFERAYEYLAFLGPLISGCGLGIALTGFVLTLRCLVGLRVISDKEYADG